MLSGGWWNLGSSPPLVESPATEAVPAGRQTREAGRVAAMEPTELIRVARLTRTLADPSAAPSHRERT